MESSKKNKPSPFIVILFSLIVVMVILYFILNQVFPDIFSNLTTGDIQPVKD